MNFKKEVLKHLLQHNNPLFPFTHSEIFLHAYCVLASMNKLGFTVGKNRYGPYWNRAYSLVGKIGNEQVNNYQ